MDLSYIHGRIHCKSSPQVWTHQYQETATLTAQTCDMIYDAKEQLAPEDDTTPPLESQGTKLVQGIVRALLYYAQALYNKLLVGLSAIGSQQAASTQRTNETINQIMDYCATYPADRILYRSSDMVLCAHFDAEFHNESRESIRAGDHIFLSENNAMP